MVTNLAEGDTPGMTDQVPAVEIELTNLARNLTAAMRRQGLNWNSLAVMSGLKADGLRDIERKGVIPSGVRLAKIAAALNVSADALLNTAPDAFASGDAQAPRPEAPGDLHHKIAEMALLALWRTLSLDEREMFLRGGLEAIRRT